jgi:integrase
MGRIYKRGEVWWAEWSDAKGERHRKTCRTRDRTVARERLRLFELAPPDTTPHTTLGAALTYFVNIACAARSAATISCYRQKARHLAQLFGQDEPIAAVNRPAVQGYIAARLAAGAHRSSVQKELVVLRSALREAGADPLVVPRFESAYQPRTRHLAPVELALLLRQLAPARQFWVIVAVYTGARLGELERLLWSHVDLVAGWIRLPGTKTEAAYRPVPIAEPLLPWLKAWAEDAYIDEPVVEPWMNYRRDLASACRRAGVPPVTANDLRRTYASWMKQAGIDSLAVAHLLGHSSTRMVDLVYGRLNPATYLAAVAALPPCTTGVPDPVHRSAPPGAPGTARLEASAGSSVPRGGIEPPTRGFSGPVRLRVVRGEDS